MTVIGVAEIDVRGRTSAFTRDVQSGVGGMVSGLASSLGGKLAAAIGVGAVIKGIGEIGIAYQDSINTFGAVADKAQLKAAGGLDAVGDAAIRLGNDLTLPNTSAADASTAMTELAKAGLSVNDTMRAAKGTLQLAAAGTLEEAQAATITANALNTFHLAGTKATDVANTLANAANVSSGEVTDFAMGLAQGGLAARNAGLDIHETAGALALFANNGLRGSDAGTSLKTMLQRLIPQTQKQAGAMHQLGLDFTDAHGSFLPLDQVAQQLHEHLGGLSQSQRALALQTIFGSDAVRAATLLYGAGAAGVDHYTDAVSKQGGAAAVAAAKSKGLGGALRGLQSQGETLALELYLKVAPGVEAVVRGVSAGIPVVTTLAGIVGHVLAPAFGLVVTGVEGVAHVIGAVVGFFNEHREAAVLLAGVLALQLVPALVNSAKAAAWWVANQLAAGVLKATDAVGALAKSFNPVQLAATAAAIGIGLMWEHDKKLAAEGKAATDAYIDSLHIVPTSLASIENALHQIESGGAVTDIFANVGDSLPKIQGAMEQLKAKRDELIRQSQAVAANETKLSQVYGLSQHDVEQLAQANGIDLAGALDVTESAITGALVAAQRSHNPNKQAADDFTKMGAAANSASDDVQLLTDAMDRLIGEFIGVKRAQLEARTSLLALDQALNKSHGSLTLQSKAGREARGALLDYTDSVQQVVEAVFKQTGSYSQARHAAAQWLAGIKESGAAGPLVEELSARIQKELDHLAQKSVDKGEASGQGIVTGLRSAGGPAAAAARYIAAKTLGGLRSLSADGRSAGNRIGTSFGQGFAGGIDAMVNSITDAARYVVASAAAAAADEQKSKSPSRVTRILGVDWGRGFWHGILDSTADVVRAGRTLVGAANEALSLGLSKHDVAGAIRRSLRSDVDNAERERDRAVRQLTHAQDKANSSAAEFAAQADIYKPLRESANKAAHEVNHLQREIDAEEHKNHPDEKRLKALRRQQDEARKTADETDRLADHAQKGYDRAEKKSKHWSDAVTEDSKRVRQAQRDLADAFRQEQVDAASAILDALSEEADALVAKADALKGAFSDAVLTATSLSTALQSISDLSTDSGLASVLQSITETTDGVTALTADPVTTYINSLTTGAVLSAQLATDIGTLVGMGLNDATIAEIERLGPAAGDAFAQSLITAGQGAVDTINSLIPDAADPVTTYIDTLQTGLDQATQLATDIGTLVGEGLNDTTIQQIVALGPVAGDAFAQALIAAGQPAVDQINALTTSIGDVATHGMDAVADSLFGPGAQVLYTLIDGIKSAFPELDDTIDEVNAKLATIGAPAVVAAGQQVGQNGAAPTHTPVVSETAPVVVAPTTTITIEGNADAQTVALLQEWADEHNAQMVQLAQTGVR